MSVACTGITCSFQNGYPLPQCVLSQSGLQRIYLAPFNHAVIQTAITYDVNCVVTGITSGITFYTFDLLPETGQFNTVVPTNVGNASQYYESTVDLVIGNNNVTLRNNLRAILAGPTLAIVETRRNNNLLPATTNGDGDLYIVGLTIGNWANSSSKFDVGKASGDFRGWMVTLNAKEPDPPFFVQNKLAFTSTY